MMFNRRNRDRRAPAAVETAPPFDTDLPLHEQLDILGNRIVALSDAVDTLTIEAALAMGERTIRM